MTGFLNIKLTDEEIDSMSSLALAHVGDAVFELLIRTWACKNKALTSRNMHRTAVGFVNAHAQAEFSEKIIPALSEEELLVFKRGRNTKVNSIPKNAEISDYHAATGLETLMGYLYLKGRNDRIAGLFEIMMR